MIVVISPAKNMKPVKSTTPPKTVPMYINDTQQIISSLRSFTSWDIGTLMHINEKLALDSMDRFAHMHFDENGTSAIETYDGIQYKYLNPTTFSEEEKLFAQQHIRILSGAYGVIKPYDSIYEYRLEMQTKLKINQFKDLYDFWNRKIYESVIAESNIIINLASNEYSKTILPYLSENDKCITCTFKVLHKGAYKVQATAAKIARGKMVRYIVQNKIKCPKDIKKFDEDGYQFEESLSTDNNYIFLKN